LGEFKSSRQFWQKLVADVCDGTWYSFGCIDTFRVLSDIILGFDCILYGYGSSEELGNLEAELY
jgi:hypothetical protein